MIPACGQVGDALRLAFPSVVPPEERFVLSFTAYFDESGTHDGSEAVVVAGYLSTAERWIAFEAVWKATLADFDLPAFHMTDFAQNNNPPFKRWPEARRRDCFGRLLTIINQHVIGSVASVIPVRLYEQVFSPEAKAYVGGAYGLAAMQCQMVLGQVLRLTGVEGMIDYVFESGAEGVGQVAHAFNEIIREPGAQNHFRPLSVAFRDKRQFAPLQAADILAYELHKQSPRDWGIDQTPPRPFPLRTLSAVPGDWGYSDQAQLAMFSEIISIRTRLSKNELEPPSDPPRRNLPRLAISAEEFQQRWRWWNQFNGRRPGVG
jgi:hypothetical protein